MGPQPEGSLWGRWPELGARAGGERLGAPRDTRPCLAGPAHGRTMGDTRQEACAGRGDGTDCPNGEVLHAGSVDPRCEECRYYWELDGTEPGRRPVEDDGLTRPFGDSDEAGHCGSAA